MVLLSIPRSGQRTFVVITAGCTWFVHKLAVRVFYVDKVGLYANIEALMWFAV